MAMESRSRIGSADHQIPDTNEHSAECTRSALMGVIVSRDFVIWG